MGEGSSRPEGAQAPQKPRDSCPGKRLDQASLGPGPVSLSSTAAFVSVDKDSKVGRQLS
jgi:hypothetical protein